MIPWLLIVLGAITIYAGWNDTNPLQLLKDVLSGEWKSDNAGA